MGPTIADISDRLRTALAQVNALLGQTSAAAPSTGHVSPGRLANGTSTLDSAPATGPGLQLTTPADEPLIDAMLAHLRTSPTGSQVVAGVERIGTRVTVMDDSQFEAAGHKASGAFYDPNSDTMFVRRSQLQTDPRRTAATFAHEATHALDDVGGVGKGFIEQQTAHHQQAGTLTADVIEQVGVEYVLAREARAFTIHTTVQRELGVQPEGMLADVVRTGANDQATYQKIFGMLVAAGPAGGYNTTGKQVAPFEL